MKTEWKEVILRARDAMREGKDKKAGFRIMAEYSMQDAEFLNYWRDLVQSHPRTASVKGQAVSFLNRLEKRGPDWDFDREFNRSFN